MSIRTNYPAGTRWLDYSTSRAAERVPGHGLRGKAATVAIATGAAAAAWGLMHLALWLLI